MTLPQQVTSDFPDLSKTIRDARAAEVQGNWLGAALLWDKVRSQAAHMVEAWLGAGIACREQGRFDEADAIFSLGLGHLKNNQKLIRARAMNRSLESNWNAAEPLWREFCEQFPDDPEGYIGLGVVFRGGGQFDNFEKLITAAFARFPDHPRLGFDYALSAKLRGDWEEAVFRNRLLLDKQPDHPVVVADLGHALRMLRLYEEAETVLLEGRRQFPNHHLIAAELAQVAVHQRDWTLAIKRSNDAIQQFSESPEVYLAMSAALRGAGFAALNQILLESAVVRFPSHVGLAIALASLSVQRGDWENARKEWRDLAARFPKVSRILSEYGNVLIFAGVLDEADRVISDSLLLFPDDAALGIAAGRLAAALNNWQKAFQIFSALHEKVPDHPHIAGELGVARYNLGLIAAENGDALDAAAEPPLPMATRIAPMGGGDPELIDLAMQFESIGENCEFGLFQRAVGAEPLGLLRFSGTPPDKLIAALKCNLSGIGSAEYTILHEGVNEYTTSDSRFGMTMHTFISLSAARDTTYKSMLQKLSFLKRKFLDDLVEGNKIFTFKIRSELSEGQLLAMRDALVALGNATLFIVRLAEPTKPNGHVEVQGRRLLVGYIDRHGDKDRRWNIPVDSWIVLCRRALALWPEAMNAS